MIEIVCPSCGARYEVPDESIGPDGRKVTCSNCSHKWRAYPETAAAPGVAESPVESPVEPPAEFQAESRAESHAESPAEAGEPDSVAPEAVMPESAAESGSDATEQPPAGSREAQMDAIRRMLDDLKRNAEDEPEAGPPPEPESIAPRSKRSDATMRRREEETVIEDIDENTDPLRSRIARMGSEGRPGKDAARPSNYDAAKLRKMHERRAKRLQKAKERQRKSGAFVTGFTLVAAVAATMVGLYVLQPQIVASSPEMAPAMNEYVVTVDRYRVALDEATASWRDWVSERVGPLLGDEQEAGGAQQAQPGTASQ